MMAVHRFSAVVDVPVGVVVVATKKDAPAVVYRVDAGSQAAQQGLQPGQVVLKVNGIDTSQLSPAALKELIRFAGDSITIEVGPDHAPTPVEKARAALASIEDPSCCASATDETAVRSILAQFRQLIDRIDALPDDTPIAENARLIRKLNRHTDYVQNVIRTATWMKKTIVVPGVVTAAGAGANLCVGQQVAYTPAGTVVIAFSTDRSAWRICTEPVDMRCIAKPPYPTPMPFHDLVRVQREMGHRAMMAQMSATPSRHSTRVKRPVSRYTP